MQSIPLAMIWDFWQRGKLVFPAAFLGAIALSGLVVGGLRLEGASDFRDPGLIPIYTIFTQFNGLIFGAAVMHAFGRPTRFYTLPVSTVMLVVWHLLPGMAAMVVLSVSVTAMLNAVFGLSWPLWGPALFLAVALAATQAGLWLTAKSAWLLLAFTIVAVVMGAWYSSRHGTPFSQPSRFWLEVTPAEVLTMLAAAALATYVACVAIARDRCGEALTSPRLRAWLERVFDPAPAFGLPFGTPAQAQFWFEWRQKGPALPAATVMGIVVGFGCWLIFNRVPQALIEGFVGGGTLLSGIGLAMGMLTGNTGPHEANLAMGQFLATRPITDRSMARTILKMAGLSALLAWVIWVVAFLAVYGILLACHLEREPVLPKGVQWWYFPATLVGLWTTVTFVASLGLMGRPKLILVLLIAGFSSFIGIMVVSKYALSLDEQMRLFQGLRFAIGLACVLGTMAAFSAARRRALVGTASAGLAGALWFALCTLVVLEWHRHPERPLSDYVLVVGFLALAVAPLAAALLALAWNRHR